MVRKQVFEVVLRGSVRAEVPGDRCCACGRRRPRDREAWRGERLEPGLSTAKQSTGARDYTFPLCDACADAKAVRDRFMLTGAAAGFTAVAGAGVALFAVHGGEGGWIEPGIQTLLLAGFAASLGTGAGWLAARLGRAVSVTLRRGERVARAAGYTYETGRPGDYGGSYNCTFRFTNEKYAHAFARANGARVIAGRRSARRLGRGRAAR